MLALAQVRGVAPELRCGHLVDGTRVLPFCRYAGGAGRETNYRKTASDALFGQRQARSITPVTGLAGQCSRLIRTGQVGHALFLRVVSCRSVCNRPCSRSLRIAGGPYELRQQFDHEPSGLPYQPIAGRRRRRRPRRCDCGTSSDPDPAARGARPTTLCARRCRVSAGSVCQLRADAAGRADRALSL